MPPAGSRGPRASSRRRTERRGRRARSPTRAVPTPEPCSPRTRPHPDGEAGGARGHARARRAPSHAGLKSYTVVGGELSFVVCLFELESGSLTGVIEADALGQRRTGAASGVAAKHLAREGARSLGVIGCGWQAQSQVDAIRTAVPTIERVVAYCRTPEKLRAFCATTGAEPVRPSDAAAQDVVVTATTSRDPVLRGEWLRKGALVCAIGANDPRAREPRQRRARARDLRLLRLA